MSKKNSFVSPDIASKDLIDNPLNKHDLVNTYLKNRFQKYTREMMRNFNTSLLPKLFFFLFSEQCQWVGLIQKVTRDIIKLRRLQFTVSRENTYRWRGYNRNQYYVLCVNLFMSNSTFSVKFGRGPYIAIFSENNLSTLEMSHKEKSMSLCSAWCKWIKKKIYHNFILF